MICILSNSQDPYFNIATEEYLLDNINDNVLMLWRSSASVIVGKHQNTLAEINHSYIKENNISVIRRLSGGGTVYHDPGNINFTFIKNQDPDNLLDYEGFTMPVISYLKGIGINAKFEGRNDIRIDRKKISGNAEHISKNRVLHHGTLLYNSDIINVMNSLKIIEGVYTDKSVRSVRSKVVNISDYMKNKVSASEFMQDLMSFFLSANVENSEYNLTEKQVKEIHSIADNKYKTWEWNYAKSPKYKFEKKINPGIELDISLNVEKGIIIEADIRPKALRQIEQALIGCKHKYTDVSVALSNIYIDNINKEELIKEMF